MVPISLDPESPQAGTRGIALAKFLAILGFLVLLSSSYYLRTEVLMLNRIRFSADEARADYELKRLQDSYPDRLERHQVDLKNYEIQKENYEKLHDLYQKDLVKYLEVTKSNPSPRRRCCRCGRNPLSRPRSVRSCRRSTWTFARDGMSTS